MTFNRLYILEATAYRKPSKGESSLAAGTSPGDVVYGLRFVGNDTGVRADTRTSDQILTSASNKGFEVRFMPDWDSIGQDKVRAKVLAEWKFQKALTQRNLDPGWIDISFRAMVYVPVAAPA